ncbi:hypothetical protein SAMN02927921_00948 [Sinomicrobium oceani]|uniref:Uncharacterized protein n=1 Tax=Sinomicrobium oceani TaxID=1150368 RepID=A0A1K1N1B9_9FLAO|nr:hypothetical protein [Sinomicrobium oceani]SFW29192.1 hypothetical protein SAMN02927921_00948 [Sinomicrobium oceani]
MISKNKKELEKLPDQIKHEINKCLEIHHELEKFNEGETDIVALHKKLEKILDKYEV